MSEEKKVPYTEVFAQICMKIYEKEELTDKELEIIKDSMNIIRKKMKELSAIEEIETKLDSITPTTEPINKKTMSEALKELLEKTKEKCFDISSGFQEKVIEPTKKNIKDWRVYREKKKEAIKKVKKELGK